MKLTPKQKDVIKLMRENGSIQFDKGTYFISVCRGWQERQLVSPITFKSLKQKGIIRCTNKIWQYYDLTKNYQNITL